MALDQAALAALVAGVPDQDAVHAADLAAAQAAQQAEVKPIPASEPEKTPDEIAIDGVAHFVFNTLRGAEDTVDGATFEDVRAIVAKGGV